MEVNGYRHFGIKKAYTDNTKLTHDDMLRSCEAKRLVWSGKKLNIIYNIITCNPEPQAKDPE